jgi:hypothetical protein
MATPFSTIPRSSFIDSFEWSGDRIPYPDLSIPGDTFPMTWAEDNNIYTSSGDPCWGESRDGLDAERFVGGPTDYTIEKCNSMNDYQGWGGQGPKPTGMICVDGILFLAFHNLLGSRQGPHSLRSQHGSDAHIIYSADKGKAWTPTLKTIDKPMFPGYKFGGPAFVNFGKNNADARDSFVYAISSDQWDNGSNLRLGRVPVDEITDGGKWQWVEAFEPSGEPAWTTQLDNAIPVLSVHRWLGAPEMVYVKAIDRYLLLTWHLRSDFSPVDGTDLIILEAPNPWGPFSLVHFEEEWEGKLFNPYCPRVPLKWMAADGLSGWIQFSGSWQHYSEHPGYYRSNVRPFRLRLK